PFGRPHRPRMRGNAHSPAFLQGTQFRNPRSSQTVLTAASPISSIPVYGPTPAPSTAPGKFGLRCLTAYSIFNLGWQMKLAPLASCHVVGLLSNPASKQPELMTVAHA